MSGRFSLLVPAAAAAGLLLLRPAASPGADWPQFRGPAGNGHVQVNSLPLEWSADRNIAWRTLLPGHGWSSPVVQRGRIYVTTAVPAEEGHSLRAICLDAESGTILWDTEVFRQPASSPAIHAKNSHASPTPIVDGDRLYVHFGHQGTACLDTSGGKVWEQRSLQYDPVHGAGGSPILTDGLLIFSADGAENPCLAALRATDGSIAWKSARRTDEDRKFSFATPERIEVGGRPQILCPASGALIAHDPATGEEIWRVRYVGYSVIPKPVFGHGLVFFSTGYDKPETIAVRPDGSGDVTSTHVVWSTGKRAPNTPSMILAGDELYTVADNGIASCIDARTGEIHWQERTARNCSASPILFRDRIYILDEFGTTTVLQASKEFRRLAENRINDGRTLASPAAIEGTIFLRTDQALYCIREKP